MWASLRKYGRIPSAGLNFSNAKVPNAGDCLENAGQWNVDGVPEASNSAPSQVTTGAFRVCQATSTPDNLLHIAISQ